MTPTTLLQPPTLAASPPAPAPSAPWHVTDSMTIVLDATANGTLATARLVDLLAPARRALAALDVGDRVALAPAVLDARAPTGLVLGFVWRIDRSRPAERIRPGDFEAFADPGHVKVRWDVQATAAGERAYLSISTRLTPTDDVARARVLDAWVIVSAVSSAMVQRAARTIKDRAETEADDDHGWA
jgi:hypothetical protein